MVVVTGRTVRLAPAIRVCAPIHTHGRRWPLVPGARLALLPPGVRCDLPGGQCLQRSEVAQHNFAALELDQPTVAQLIERLGDRLTIAPDKLG